MNFKIRVVKNIGESSERAFGTIGTIHSVVNGDFTDLEDYKWSNRWKLFHNIEDVNQYFGNEDEFQTKFELVEE